MEKRDILIIGGGTMGLAIALELKLQGCNVTVLSRDYQEAAGHAAAGMLAPQAEGIPAGAMLDLCLRSRSDYPAWVDKIQTLSGLDVSYWPCGILAPVYQQPTSLGAPEFWCEPSTIQQIQPDLSPDVIGGFWFPKDAQVDNQQLIHALYLCNQALGIEICPGITVQTIHHQGGKVTHLTTSAGEWQAEHYVLATGAWSEALLPIPVTPRKGQMLALGTPPAPVLCLQTVLFGPNIYIVPRQDGRIILGATSEEVGFTPGNTPRGIQHLLSAALRLVPVLADYPIQDFWWGFRPTTPDELPILGASPYANLTLATGHYRNGILLAPITAQLIAQTVLSQPTDLPLAAFHWSRFSPAAPEKVTSAQTTSHSILPESYEL
jgi:thiazole synthase